MSRDYWHLESTHRHQVIQLAQVNSNCRTIGNGAIYYYLLYKMRASNDHEDPLVFALGNDENWENDQKAYNHEPGTH